MALEMPLEWLLGLVVAGVPLAILLVHVHGGSENIALNNAVLSRTLDQQLPGKRFVDLLVSADQHTALLLFEDGGLGIAWSMERHATVRELGSLARLELSETGLTLRMQDPAWVPRTLTGDADTLATWHQRLSQLGGRHAA